MSGDGCDSIGSVPRSFGQPPGRCFAIALFLLILGSGALASDRDLRAKVAAAVGVRTTHSCFSRPVYFATLGMDFRHYGTAIVEIPDPMVPRNRTVVKHVFVFPLLKDGSIAGTPSFSEKSTVDVSRFYHSGAGYRLRESVAVGEGRHLAVATYANDAGHGCVISWRIEAKLQHWERGHIPPAMAPGEARSSMVSVFGAAPPVSRSRSGPRTLILFNVDSIRRARAVPDIPILADTVAILRALAQHPGMAGVGLIAFSLDDGKVLSAQPIGESIDYPAVQDAMAQLDPAEVALEELGRESPPGFLEEIFRTYREWFRSANLITFVGATSPIDLPEAETGAPEIPRAPQCRVAYLVNVRHARAYRAARRPKDLMDRIVERAGGTTYPISDPLSLAKTVNRLAREAPALNTDAEAARSSPKHTRRPNVPDGP